MNELITIKKDEAVTTSLIIANQFNKRHDNVIADIRRLDCSAEFTALNFKESRYKDSTGKYNPMYYLTKDGFMFLVMGYRGKKAADIKENYIKAFNSMEKVVREKQTSTWIETRQQGKFTRKAETDVLKQLVEYAKGQGSKNSEMLYMAYSKLANKLAGIKDRETATVMQLNNLSLAEHIILTEIKNGIIAEVHYKDIYKSCKARLEALSDIAYLEVTA